MPTLEFDNDATTIVPGVHLSEYTTFQLGGPVKGLIHCQSPRSLVDAIKNLNVANEDFFLMGGGSNLVVSDEGLDCYVIRYASQSPRIRLVDNELTVSASTMLDDLALYSAMNGLSGLIYTSGIPGTVGGAIVGNAGAFGRQVGDVLVKVTVVTRQGQLKTLLCEELEFRYRHSILKISGDIVVDATFRIQQTNNNDLQKERQNILAERRSKHPDLSIDPCAGSFFRNIEPTSSAGRRQATGWFLEQAGGKNLKVGGAEIYPKHANIIIKKDGCTAQDVLALSKLMAKLVKDHFDVDIKREVRFVGNIDGKPDFIKDRVW